MLVSVPSVEIGSRVITNLCFDGRAAQGPLSRFWSRIASLLLIMDRPMR